MDDEFNAYAVETLSASDVLIMGRRTYALMAGYWPTAHGNDPVVKEKINGTPKLAFSRTLKRVDWQNSRLATGSVADEVTRLKRVPGDGLLWVGRSDLLQVGERGLDVRACYTLTRRAPECVGYFR